MPHGHRISALDASFLHLEKSGERLHVASVTVFDGPAPPYDELREHIESRLHLVPRFRQRHVTTSQSNMRSTKKKLKERWLPGSAQTTSVTGCRSIAKVSRNFEVIM